jgi:hypothetical protein
VGHQVQYYLILVKPLGVLEAQYYYQLEVGKRMLVDK